MLYSLYILQHQNEVKRICKRKIFPRIHQLHELWFTLLRGISKQKQDRE